MKFKVGDNIIFKKEKQSGIIVKINSLYKVKIETSDGFNVDVSVDDIILTDSITEKASAYGSDILHKDVLNINKTNSKQKRSQTVLKIDLHVELLTSDYQNMHNSEIIQLQLTTCQKKLEYSLNSKITKVIIIHGIGKGVLKEQVHQLLQDYKLRYYLSRDGGATEVIL